MFSLNKIILIGNVGTDVECFVQESSGIIRKVREDKELDRVHLLRFRLAVTEKVKRRNSSVEESTEWLTVSVFGVVANKVKYLVKKGDRVYVEGKLRTVPYHSEDDSMKVITNVVASRVLLVDPRYHNGQDRTRVPDEVLEAEVEPEAEATEA